MADDTGTSLLEQPEIVTIETDRLQLKTVQMSDLDLDAIMPLITSKEVMQFTYGIKPLRLYQFANNIWFSAHKVLWPTDNKRSDG